MYHLNASNTLVVAVEGECVSVTACGTSSDLVSCGCVQLIARPITFL